MQADVHDGADGEKDRAVTLHIIRHGDGSLELSSAEAPAPSARMRMIFSTPTALEAALTPGVAREVRKIVDGCPRDSMVMSLPDYMLRLERVWLMGARVLIMGAQDGLERISVRFRKVVGDMMSLFRRAAVTFSDGLDATGDLVSVALNELYLPLADLRAHLRNVLAHENIMRTDILLSQLEIIEKKLELFEDSMRLLIAAEQYKPQPAALSSPSWRG